MSYRSIKRVLGETSLERKCRILFGVCLFLLIAASFWFYGSETDEIVREENRRTGWLLTSQELKTRHMKFMTENEKINTAMQRASDSFKEQYYDIQFLVPNITAADLANNPEHGSIVAPDSPFEEELLRRFPANKAEVDGNCDKDECEKRPSADGKYYTYYQAIRANDATCFSICHRSLGQITNEVAPLQGLLGFSTGSVKGDLMAIAKLTFSTESTRSSIVKNRAIMVATAIITMFLAMVASYVIVRYVIVKPLHHLRDVSDAISRGNTTLRADIHTGDEFDELAVAFNRMLRHLTDAQQELRQTNVSLDGKVDELAQANMRLYEMNMLKSDFLATMSHELRTPLNSILGFSDLLGSNSAIDEKQKRYVQNIQKSGRTLLEMINDILDLAKIESGKMQTRLSEFRIAQVVASQCDLARPLTERKNIDLDCHVDQDLPPLLQDQARVQQILNNLLSNAIKFTPEGGRITVSVERDAADCLVLRVADTGVGITADDQQVIFDKFRQGRTAMPGGDAMTREHSGSGLGLSIVKELCKLLGGDVSVESELGKGSTFTVRLPWTFEEQPRLDSALVESMEEFTKQRFEPMSDPHAS